MKNSIARMCGVGVVSLLLLTSIDAAGRYETRVGAPAADAQVVRAPRDARELANRTDLTHLFQQHPEIRIVVGMQTPQDSGAAFATAPDSAKEKSVAARQERVLQRALGLNIKGVKRLRLHPFMSMTVDATALGQLLTDFEVTSISEDGVIFPALVDTVSITRATNAWAEGFQGAGQTIAVIDSGIDAIHPFLAGKVVAEACFSNPITGSTTLCPNGQSQQIGPGAAVNCADMSIACWHGTHVAGIAAGNYGYLSASSGGIAPAASLMPIQVFQRDCSRGTCQLSASYSDIMQSLEYVYSLRNSYAIAAANLSLGGMNFSAACDNEAPGVTSVIQSLRAADIPTVIASGNSAMIGALTFPACISQAISVGSTTKQNAISDFSNSASFLSLLAPGSSITSSVPGGGYGYTSGTSMAAPHVSGAWATLKSAKPTATVAEVLAALTSGGMPMTDPRNGITKSLIQIGDTGTQLGALGVLLGRGAPSGSEIIIDNAAAGATDAAGGRTFTGSWCTASAWNEFGADALSNCAGAAVATYRWTPTLPTAGSWDVFMWWSAQSYQSAAAQVTVVSVDGAVTKPFDEKTGGGQWVLHGRYNFNAGAAGYVEVTNGGSGHVSADAVRFVPIGGPPPSPVITISATDLLAKEAGLDPGAFTVARTGNAASDLTVQYKVGGTAAPDADYLALSGTITIPTGASTAVITVTPLDDALVESNETIVVTLLAGPGYTLGTSSAAILKIASDDVAAGRTAGAPQEASVLQTAASPIGPTARKIKKQVPDRAGPPHLDLPRADPGNAVRLEQPIAFPGPVAAKAQRVALPDGSAGVRFARDRRVRR